MLAGGLEFRSPGTTEMLGMVVGTSNTVPKRQRQEEPWSLLVSYSSELKTSIFKKKLCFIVCVRERWGE